MSPNYFSYYPQLLQPIRQGISKTMEYQRLLKLCLVDSIANEFWGDPEDFVDSVTIDSTAISIIHLAQRQDFVQFIQAIVFKGEPFPIPDTTGAMTILGVRNYGRILEVMGKPRPQTVAEWDKRYNELVSLNGKGFADDTIIVLTKGPYSLVSHQDAGMDENEWLRGSQEIRIYHELSHVLSRRKYPNNKHPVRDEVIADAVGMLHAFGRYDCVLAKLFLGYNGGNHYIGGRIKNYLKDGQAFREVSNSVIQLITRIDALCSERHFASNPMGFLKYMEKNEIGLEMF